MKSSRVIRRIHDEVRAGEFSVPGFPFPSRKYWRFIFLIALAFLITYATILYARVGFLQAVFLYTICYSSTSILAISLGHQSFHGAMLRSRAAGRIVGTATFTFLGVDGPLWRKRHVMDHHRHPNTQDHDGDLDNPLFFRLAPYTEHRWYHSYQHIYAIFVYSAGVLVTIVFEDFRQLLSELLTSPMKQSALRTTAGFLSRKLLFAVIWIYLPCCLNDGLTPIEAFIALCAATVPTAWFFLPIGAAHLNEHTRFFARDEEQEHFELQKQTTVDYCRNSQFMTMLYGGLNFHLAHHLWPKVASCHYSEMYRLLLLRSNNGGDVVSMTLAELFRSHFSFLKRMGINTPP